MDLDPIEYSLAIGIFFRLLGLIYLFAYIPFLFQIRGLIGEEGILPLSIYLKAAKKQYGKKRIRYVPTLFWLNASDVALLSAVWLGIVMGIFLLFGFQQPLIFLILYLLHLSITAGGQDFLAFGWETYLMEITVASFFMTLTAPYNLFGWLALNFLLFRFYIQAGMSKIQSGDKSWRDLTAIAYHYLTQPIPNLQAWYFHKFPMAFHKFSVLVMFYAELIAPLFMWGGPLSRLFAFTQVCGLQISIWFTGNLSYLNHMTAFQSVILIHNKYLEPIFGSPIQQESSSVLWYVLASIPALIFLLLQVFNLIQTFVPTLWFQKILVALQHFHICYPHGIFAVMTTVRNEIILEGSDDGVNWKEYEFYHKPGDLKKRPARISPYQPRLDWQAWFLPFRSVMHQVWFQLFLIKILEGAPLVLKLLKNNPFPEKPPKYIRVLMYDYVYTTREEKKRSGHWWKRTLVGESVRPFSLTGKKEIR